MNNFVKITYFFVFFIKIIFLSHWSFLYAASSIQGDNSQMGETSKIVKRLGLPAEMTKIPQIQQALQAATSKCQNGSKANSPQETQQQGRLPAQAKDYDPSALDCIQDKMRELFEKMDPKQRMELATKFEQLILEKQQRDKDRKNAAVGRNNSGQQAVISEIEKIKLEPEQSDILRYKSGSAYRKLKTFLSNRLEAGLYGELDKASDSKRAAISTRGGSKRKVVDHLVFYRIMKSQLGKNALSDISFYCLNADPAYGFTIPSSLELRKLARKENIEKLAQSTEGGNMGFMLFQACMQKIPQLCVKEDVENNKLSAIWACNVVNDLKKIRKAIAIIDDTQNKFQFLPSKKLDNRHVGFSLGPGKIYNEGKNANERSIDDLTAITSKELTYGASSPEDQQTQQEAMQKPGARGEDQSGGLIQNLKEEAQLFKKLCIDSQTPACSRFGIDPQEIQSFLSGSAEMETRTQAIIGKILGMPSEQVGQYLKERGYNDSDISQLTALNQGSLEKLKMETAKEIAAEKGAVIKALGRQLESRNVMNKPPEQRVSLFNKRIDEAYTLQAHSFYNNIVTGLLKVEKREAGKEGSTIQQNTQQITRELQNGLPMLEDLGINTQSIRGAVMSSKSMNASASNNGAPEVSTSFINQVLNSKYYQQQNSKQEFSPTKR